ncbi:MAG: site-specific DNA-methyltransferase [Bacteroides sp.]|nr:site-specific DNA-methyltransferase [Prevotella sp.]MCM1408715.1 site-specific DNA-methyltransferase [Treponema brennaborense]MCM1470630.1 site-specific DNA-methyltransferase [Bacteroides sp.]
MPYTENAQTNALKLRIEKILRSVQGFAAEASELKMNKIKESAESGDALLLAPLLKDAQAKKAFFTPVLDSFVFKTREFKEFLDFSFACNSYSKYLGKKIGLYFGDEEITDRTEVVLNFPFKDCVLQGGQTKEDGLDAYYKWNESGNGFAEASAKRGEIFYNQVLARDEIDELFSPKAFANAKVYDKNGEKPCAKLHRDAKLNERRGLPPDTITDNLIIKGNNLLALHSLKEEFAGKVKLIYIDPPYNTGSDNFSYNDNFNHSSWLTFMKNRLEAARELLKEDGCIFVQIDNNEQAYLKVLMDEIFGRENFIETITVVNNPRGRDYGGIANMHEFIQVYVKNISNYEFNRLPDPNKKFPFADSIGEYEVRELRNRNTAFTIENRPNLCYPFYVNPNKKVDNNFLELSLEPKKGFVKVYPAKSMGKQTVWRWGKEKSQKNLNVNIVGKAMQEDGRFMIVEKYRESSQMARSVWWDKEVNSERGTIHLRELFGEKAFMFPKPEETLQRILQISTNPSDIVLDYHFGSGTSAAVAHKMRRQYIGVEQMDYVKTISCERLKKVIAGEQGGISKSANWNGGGSFVYAELAQKNQKAISLINACKTYDELISLFDSLCAKYFLHYNVRVNEFKNEIAASPRFKELPLSRQKEMFCRMLDLNQLYVNFCGRTDKDSGLSKSDIAFTEDFYKKLKEEQ